MKISSALLKPQISEIKNEYENLSGKLNYEFSTEDMSRLNSFIQKELDLNQQLIDSVTQLEQESQQTAIPADLFQSYKRLKANLRTAKRIWDRLISNQRRALKFQKKRKEENAPSVAA